MNLRTSSEDKGWRTEIGVPKNSLLGKGDMGDEARVLAIDSLILVIFEMKMN